MFKPSSQFNRKTPVPQLLDAFVQMVRPHLSFELTGTRISETDMLYVLGYAALQHNSLEHACLELKGAPSGNRVREVLHAGLPEAVSLQRRLNTILRRQLPRGLLKTRRRYALALDITLIPYHGQAQQDPAEVVIAGAKSGTKHFHAYATVAIVHDRKRYTLALRFVRLEEFAEDLQVLLAVHAQALVVPVLEADEVDVPLGRRDLLFRGMPRTGRQQCEQYSEQRRLRSARH